MGREGRGKERVDNELEEVQRKRRWSGRKKRTGASARITCNVSLASLPAIVEFGAWTLMLRNSTDGTSTTRCLSSCSDLLLFSKERDTRPCCTRKSPV